MLSLYKILSESSNKKFIILSFLISLVASLAINLIINFFISDNFQNSLSKESLTTVFLFTVIFSPFIETLLFQFLPIEIGLSFIKKTGSVILLFAFLFSIMHIFNEKVLIDKVLIFFATFIWASIYVLAKQRKRVNGFLLVLSIHCFENFLAFLVNNII